MKLYRVNLKGMKGYTCSVAYGESYVVAENTDEAYVKVRKYLDDNDLGFRKDRELDSVELIAEDVQYPECGIKLYL